MSLLRAEEARAITDTTQSLERILNKVRKSAGEGFYATNYTLIANTALWDRIAQELRALGYRIIVLDRTREALVTFNINWEFSV